MSRIFPRGRAEVEANVTPMIDVTFLLIVFFVLVSQIVEVENPENLRLPEPTAAETIKPEEGERAVINILPLPDGSIERYKVGSRLFDPDAEGVAAMVEHLAGLFQRNPGVQVNLRADRGTQYEHVQPVFEAVSAAAARAGIEGLSPRINLVVINEEGS